MKFFYSLLFIICTTTYSCKKCQTCSIVNNEDSNVVYTYDEECGKKKDLENSRKKCEDEYAGSSFGCACSDA